jgi:osmotically-inducible protein OsmY
MRVTALAIGVALALFVGAAGCTKRPDPSVSTEKALKEANLTTVKVEWDDDARIAHLRGRVDSVADRDRAAELAASAVGTSGKVLNEVTIKDVNEHTADDLDGQIRSELKRMIDHDPAVKDRDINFDVTNGVVTVKGEVRTVAEKTRVTELVRSAPGVKDFANALEVKAEK